MSRTYKDKKWKLRYPENDYTFGTERIAYEFQCRDWETGKLLDETYTRYVTRDLPGVKTKKPRNVHGDWEWVSNTPSWWVKEFMTAPTRARCRNWEKTRTLDNLDEICPDYGRKPHQYYW